MLRFIDNIMSSFLSAYHSSYSSQHVLFKLTEEWKTCLDDNKIVEVCIVMNLSEAFDCIPHDFLTAKLQTYELRKESLLLLKSC